MCWACACACDRLSLSLSLRQLPTQPYSLPLHHTYPQPKKEKNISKDEMGDTFGRIHLGRQDLDKLQTRKMKGLKKSNTPAGATAGGAAEGDNEPADDAVTMDGIESE